MSRCDRYAEEHGLQAGHRASRRRAHTVVRVPTLPSIPALKTPLGLSEARRQQEVQEPMRTSGKLSITFTHRQRAKKQKKRTKNKMRKQCKWWCAACGGQYNWRDPNRVLVTPDSANLASVSGPRGARSVRESWVRSQAFGEPADGRRHPRGYALRGLSGEEQIEDHG